MSQAEVTFKFVTDASGMLQAVNQLTGEVLKLGKAEDDLKKKIEAAKQATLERIAIAKELKSFNDSAAAHEAGPQKSHVERVRESAIDRIAKAQEVRAAGLGGDGLTVRERIRQEAAARQDARLQQSIRSNAELSGEFGMRAMGGRLMGLGGAAVGIAAGGIALAGSYAQSQNQIDRNAWMSDAARERERQEATPLGVGWLRRNAREVAEYVAGTPDEKAKAERSALREDSKVQRQRDFASQIDARKSEVIASGAASISTRHLGLPQLDRVDRSTVVGERKRAEDLMMLPARTTEARGFAEVEGKSYLYQATATERNKLRAVIADSENKLKKLAEQLRNAEETDRLKNTGGDSIGTNEIRRDFVRERDNMASFRSRDVELAKREEDALKQVEEAKKMHLSGKSGPDFLQGRLNVLQDREGRASQTAYSLGMAGPEQRFMAEQARVMAKQIGYEYLPPELKQQHASLFPEESRKMAEQTGFKIAPKYYGNSDEYPHDLSEVRTQSDDVRDALQKAIQESDKDKAKAIADIMYQDRLKLIDAIREAIYSRDYRADVQKALENSPGNK